MQTHSSVLGTHLLLKQYGSFSVSSYLWKFTHSQHLPFLLQVFDGQLHNEEYKLISHTILSLQQQRFLIIFMPSSFFFPEKNLFRFSGITYSLS